MARQTVTRESVPRPTSLCWSRWRPSEGGGGATVHWDYVSKIYSEQRGEGILRFMIMCGIGMMPWYLWWLLKEICVYVTEGKGLSGIWNNIFIFYRNLNVDIKIRHIVCNPICPSSIIHISWPKWSLFNVWMLSVCCRAMYNYVVISNVIWK